MNVPYDILILILQDIVYINFCYVNKITYHYKEKIIKDICIRHGATKLTPKNRDPWIWLLLQYYPHRLHQSKLNKHKKYILEFLCNQARKSTIISCKSNHTKILKFCTNYNLLCEELHHYKKIKVCPYCSHRGYTITNYHYFCQPYCKHCKYTDYCFSIETLKLARIINVHMMNIK